MTSPSSTERTGVQTVESFTLQLDNFSDVLQAEAPAKWLEAQLLVRLDSPVRLLRWAIVQIEENQSFWCEGAYLRRP